MPFVKKKKFTQGTPKRQDSLETRFRIVDPMRYLSYLVVGESKQLKSIVSIWKE